MGRGMGSAYFIHHKTLVFKTENIKLVDCTLLTNVMAVTPFNLLTVPRGDITHTGKLRLGEKSFVQGAERAIRHQRLCVFHILLPRPLHSAPLCVQM